MLSLEELKNARETVLANYRASLVQWNGLQMTTFSMTPSYPQMRIANSKFHGENGGGVNARLFAWRGVHGPIPPYKKIVLDDDVPLECVDVSKMKMVSIQSRGADIEKLLVPMGFLSTDRWGWDTNTLPLSQKKYNSPDTSIQDEISGVMVGYLYLIKNDSQNLQLFFKDGRPDPENASKLGRTGVSKDYVKHSDYVKGSRPTDEFLKKDMIAQCEKRIGNQNTAHFHPMTHLLYTCVEDAVKEEKFYHNLLHSIKVKEWLGNTDIGLEALIELMIERSIVHYQPDVLDDPELIPFFQK